MPRLLAILCAACLSGIGSASLASELRIVTSVVPLKTFVERIGGERVSVSAIVGPGDSPATYSPTPRQVADLVRAELYFRVGVPFEEGWMPRLRSANREMRVVDLREGLELRPLAAHAHDETAGHAAHAHVGDAGSGEHDDEIQDPHVWTDPRRVMTMIATIRDELVRLDPAGEAAYRARYRAYRKELERLDSELREALADVQGRRFLVFHPSWGYFAAAYGLEQIAIEQAGKSPGAATLTRVIERAREDGIRVVFVQRQFSQAEARTAAEAIGGDVIAVDPLAADYVENLRRVAGELARALRGAGQASPHRDPS